MSKLYQLINTNLILSSRTEMSLGECRRIFTGGMTYEYMFALFCIQLTC